MARLNVTSAISEYAPASRMKDDLMALERADNRARAVQLVPLQGSRPPGSWPFAFRICDVSAGTSTNHANASPNGKADN